MFRGGCISLSSRHRFEDTLALFIVFLSFNHFSSLCLLVTFILMTKFKNFITNMFITLFLQKKPSPRIEEVSHIESVGSLSSQSSSMKVPNGAATSKKLSRNQNTSIFKEKFILAPFLHAVVEFTLATVLKVYGGNYFVVPTEKLAIAIIASFMINDPGDCLSYATICTVLYAVSSNILKRLAPFNDGPPFVFYQSIKTFPLKSPLISFFYRYSLILFKLLHLFVPTIPNEWNKYITHLCYYLSLHIVYTQFARNTVFSSDSQQPVAKKNSVLRSLSTSSPHGFKSHQAKDELHHRIPSATSQRILSSSSAKNDNSLNTNVINDNPAGLKNNTANIGKSNNNKTFVNNILPHFTNVVGQIKTFEPTVTVPEKTNVQTVTTTSTEKSSNTSSSNVVLSNNENNFINQFYEIGIENLDTEISSDLKTDITVTSNLENFIRYLFEADKKVLISPLWSILVTLKTTNFEKKYLKEFKETKEKVDDLTPLSSSNDDTITPVPSVEEHGPHNSLDYSAIDGRKRTKSVFNRSDDPLNSMALIAQTASDDFSQLNLLSTNDNIFNRKENDYKVCIVEIGTHSLTFHIENLHDGELIVLVNGLIWSEVSCSLILEHVGEEYVVVNGLVPSCSYDIQFINRLNQTAVFFNTDLIIRTKGQGDRNVSDDSADKLSKNFEKLDLTFPSYYHRKFLSPLLTLKHSVLTTNANLSDERLKLKKTKKEITKKLNAFKQEIDHLKNKLKQNASTEEKNSSKVENLKIALQQNENSVAELEEEFKNVSKDEFELEDRYLEKKNYHLKKELEFSKAEENLKKKLDEVTGKMGKLETEYNQLLSRKEKLEARRDRLQKELDQNNEIFEVFKANFLQKKEKERSKREDIRAREINELELQIKGLEQDISRLEAENERIQPILNRY
ncbi:hypothetical protein KAFR_0K01510 [Kazachstania africana CBS 2517]|uniref:Uncharacterized protein n=1 Tax=Kazachstania africana (strain ATCC 22294 / BCRC 22015 / CBS 2517 / CECT 1963 / NBRC 1671 / NRRL Y-8276) TaxID=1071382 RepID=H2B1K5_KAZAF|nr:hypothetical protein KAFR_0K01510 [Kazachstania africana CBS 2517]CCF60505.1 hypothetical protein KAFR_0K01510 [Kazachstania africana CBS 2517]